MCACVGNGGCGSGSGCGSGIRAKQWKRQTISNHAKICFHFCGTRTYIHIVVKRSCDCRHDHLALIEVYLLCSRKVLLLLPILLLSSPAVPTHTPLSTASPMSEIEANYPKLLALVQGLAGSLNYSTQTHSHTPTCLHTVSVILSEQLPFASCFGLSNQNGCHGWEAITLINKSKTALG